MDKVFKTGVTGEIEVVKISELKAFSEEIFKPYEGARLDEMVESIKSYGVITPIIVRAVDGSYEILSGKNRVNGAKLAGLERVPVISRGALNDDEARFIITESNVSQRGFMELSISERARCITVRHAAMKSQGMRKDLMEEVELLLDGLDDQVAKMDVDAALSGSFDLSATNVKRYVRIDQLTDELKKMVDDKIIGFVAGVELSFLEDEHQRLVADVIDENGFKVSIKQAKALRELEAKDEFTQDKVFFTLVKETIGQPIQAKVSRDLMARFFEGYDSAQINEILEKALVAWFGSEEKVG